MNTAVFFDFDGVIADSEPLHYRAYQEVLGPAGMGFPWAAYLDEYIGYDDRNVFSVLFRRAGRPLDDAGLRDWVARKGQAFLGIVAREPPRLYPGARELIEALAGRVPLALCTGALPPDIEPILRGAGLRERFEVVVTAADVAASKPDPTCYRLARERLARLHPELDLPAAHGIAIEDTPAGIDAARGAGLRVLAVASTHPAAALGRAHRVVASLGEVTADGLLAAAEART